MSDRLNKATASEAVEIRQLLRLAMAGACETGNADLVSTLGSVIAKMTRNEADRDGPNPKLPDWHELALDAAAAVRRMAPTSAEELTAAAEVARRTLLIAARNPADRLVSRPSSRRVLMALHELGGRSCSQPRVREVAGQNPAHFSNCLRALRAAGFVESEMDPENGRERRLSLTDAARAAIAAHVRRPVPILHRLALPDRRKVERQRPARMRIGASRVERYKHQIRQSEGRPVETRQLEMHR